MEIPDQLILNVKIQSSNETKNPNAKKRELKCELAFGF
jgi:hypothetical protein